MARPVLIQLDPRRWEPVDPRRPAGRRRLTAECPTWLNGSLLAVLPAGLESDGMSFPWFVRLTWDDPWHDRYEPGAWLHDGLLHLLAQGQTALSKWQIDWLAHGCWRDHGVSALEAWIFTNAVRTQRG
jgi:hypothetical protein